MKHGVTVRFILSSFNKNLLLEDSAEDAHVEVNQQAHSNGLKRYFG